jgi:ketosteroid isomerase-like protein
MARSQGTSDDLALRQIEAETGRLEQKNDTSIAKYLADDWVCVGARALSKREFIANVKSNLDTHENGINPYTIEKRNLVVRVFGDTAVVTYIKEYRQTPDTTKFFNEDDTDVFTRDSAGWHLRFTKTHRFSSRSVRTEWRLPLPRTTTPGGSQLFREVVGDMSCVTEAC